MTDKEREESTRCDNVRALFTAAFIIAAENNVRVYLYDHLGFHVIEGESKLWMEAQ